ncbi:hypothetical protein [Rhodococcus sp. HNM0569]|uniref:hypothetical protein n=1 Tax=Rhodococcus sp. HNM0569 TaxID=2716340 RepID=UPI00146F6493|nr:hypothetical protein [Rhodococcus sp. HNM0569]NLU83815.1 hypothetical protein [Rhodococcus sp. HNM0569]
MNAVHRALVRGVAAVAAVSTVASCSEQDTPREPERLGALVDRVVAASPDRESTNYVPPSPGAAQAVAAGVAELLDTGSTSLDSYDLEPVSISGGNAESGGESPGVSALVEQGKPTAGNGLYVVRDVTSPLVVQIPHPVADKNTEHMGAQLFSETDARMLMMAGAHRRAGDDSADVAHRSDTTFAAVNDAVVQKGTTVVQIHGFSSDNHDSGKKDDDLGEVVLSSTVDQPSPVVRRLADDLEDNGFDTCTYDGKKCAALAATTNVQAISARARGADFVHIEVDQDIRNDRSERRELMRVIAESLRASGVG